MLDASRIRLASLRLAGDLPGTHGHRPYLLVFGGDAGVDDRYRHRGRSPDGRGEQPMTPIAPFLREHMPIERGYSPQTCETYAYAFRLLFLFASERLKQQPSQLCLEHIDVALVLSFLTHIEQTVVMARRPVTLDLRRSRPSCATSSSRFHPLWTKSGRST